MPWANRPGTTTGGNYILVETKEVRAYTDPHKIYKQPMDVFGRYARLIILFPITLQPNNSTFLFFGKMPGNFYNNLQ